MLRLCRNRIIEDEKAEQQLIMGMDVEDEKAHYKWIQNIIFKLLIYWGSFKS